MSQKLKVSDLCPHKDNDYFFDDITGEAWQEFIDSIKTSGVIEPIVVTQNKVIVSGHQRVRACKLLEIEEIDAEVKIFDSEDEIIKCLIETNIRQRGIGNTNPVKFGRCLKELERIYGIKQGKRTDLETFPQDAEKSISQEDLASQFGMSVDTLNRYKTLADSIPEIQNLVETGIVTPSVARAIIKKLPEFQQKELADKFASEGIKVPLKKAEEEIERLKANEIDLREECDYLQSKVKELQDKVPDDYEEIKRKAEMADAHESDFKTMQKAYEKMSEKWKQSELEKQKIIDEAKKPEIEQAEKLRRSALSFCAGVANFIEQYGGYVWLTEHINEMAPSERKGYLSAINAVESWTQAIKENMKGVI